MSLSTVAATAVPDARLANLPASQPERFQRSDFIAAGLVFAITLGVYIATMAPSVTLQDSGELITGAVTFGVPHPPGYPLWTLSGFLLSHLFPFGNMAWRINLESALFGAAANAVLTLLVGHSGRWLVQRWADPPLQSVARQFCFYAALMAGMTMGFSDVMWGEAVISEVYTLNALFVTLTLLFFYLWMLEPHRTERLVVTVFVFALGLTNHHTLVQIIPAFLLAAAMLQLNPARPGHAAEPPSGIFSTIFLAVNLFSLSILVYISWLSGDSVLQTISDKMAWGIFILTAVTAFSYTKEFRLHLFALGALTVMGIFAYGHYLLAPTEGYVERNPIGHGPFWTWGTLVHPGWLQITSTHGWWMLALGAAALGLVYTSTLNRRLIIGIFAAGWVGLAPYSYERIASSTNPPMNWGFASVRSGFYYEVSREQYPKSLPILIKLTFGKAIGVVDKDAKLDATIGQPNYFKRLGMAFYFYGYNLQDNFTVPVIVLTLAVLIFLRRCDRPQANWFVFLGAAFFLLGFMLQLIAPQEGFDIANNVQYKVFHLQSHCIFVLLMGYGALATMTYLYEAMEEMSEQIGVVGFGAPALCLALLPLWSNFDDCNEAGHWFGYNYGYDMMRPMEKNAVYFGGSDAGRFVPTYMAFVESQQPNRWKRDTGFDRRDVAVITQNALCDTYYTQYIRNQYDERFRPTMDQYSPFEKWLGRDRAYPPQSVACESDSELQACWNVYRERPEVKEREKRGEPGVRPGSGDVFQINGIVAEDMFQKNKDKHAFYLEQSVPMEWTYPYLVPSGLIFRLNPEPLTALPPGTVEEDRKFWDAYSQRLLADPKFRVDDDAQINFAKLAFWHADLYRYREMEKEQEYWLRLAISLCGHESEAVNSLAALLAKHQRYDEAIVIVEKALAIDPYSTTIAGVLKDLKSSKIFSEREVKLRERLQREPYNVKLNLELAELLEDQSKYTEVNERLKIAAGLTNWSHDSMRDVVQYYVDTEHNAPAAIAFLEERAKITPDESELIYTLASLHALIHHKEEALKFLAQSVRTGGTNSMTAAKIDPRFDYLRNDPQFQALVNPSNAAPVMPATNATSLKDNAAPTPKPPASTPSKKAKQ